MRGRFLFLLILVAQGCLFGQGYYIKDYQVRMEVNPDASVHVTERLLVHFDEERRGIIRSIPYEGASALPQSGDIAYRSAYGDRYAIHLIDIEVENHPYTTYTQSGYQYIRIGDPDVFLTGDQVYTIRYKVYGAVQEFESNAELPWNVIGNEWDTRIEKSSFVITYPGEQRVSEDDLLAYTGYRGSTQQSLKITRQPGKVVGEVTSELRPGQGVSIAIRFPKSIFKSLVIPAALITKNYVYTNLDTRISLQKDGSTHVTEVININAITSTSRFLRILNLPPGEDASGNTVYPFIDALNVQIRGLGPDAYRVSLYPSQEQTLLEIIPNVPFTGEHELRLDYTVWGSVSLQQDDLLLRWNLMSTFAPEPIEHYRIRMTLPEGYSTTGFLDLPYPKRVQDKLAETTRSTNGYSVESRRRVLAGDDLNLSMGIRGDKRILSHMPRQVYAKEYWVQHFDKVFRIEKDGSVSVRENYYPRFRYQEGTSSFGISVPLGVKRPKEKVPFFRGHNILGRQDRYYYQFDNLDKLELGTLNHPYQELQIEEGITADEADFLSAQYSVDGLAERNGDMLSVKYPVWVPTGEPLRSGTIKLEFEKDVDPEAVKGNIVTEDGVIVSQINHTGSTWEGYIPDDRYSGIPLYLEIQFPSRAAPGFNLFSSIALFWLNNRLLVISLGIFLVLFSLWRWIGKDNPGTIIARFRPPEGMPPAEAGFIWDGKLHGKDMTALIYYWAANGHLKIRELEGKKKKKPDYELVKLRGLDSTAREYERIFFNGLFTNGNEVRISSLKNTFYTTYNKARKAFFRFERKAGYYAKGTRGFGLILIVLGLFLGIVGGVPLTIFSFIEKDFTYSIPVLISAVSLVVFGRIMPRMKPWAQQALDELAGFREFIRTAERDRLKTLIDEDPGYFGLTLPYAIVMGEGDRWGEKFEDILTVPPEWYEGYDGGTFSSRMFTYHMIHSMHDMRSTFTSVPAPSGGSGSSWSGGSSFGGGFSGGGGFGGGGGGSW